MHVKTKMMAFGGLFLALSVVFMTLGSVMETSTLFLLAAASYFVGIVVREFGLKAGAVFYLAAVLLGLMLAPNKFYVISFAGMGLYIWASEWVWRRYTKMPGKLFSRKKFWVLKYVMFNVLYLPAVFLFQELLFARKISGTLLLAVLVMGQVGLFIYDNAYEYVQGHIWSKLRGHMFSQ